MKEVGIQPVQIPEGTVGKVNAGRSGSHMFTPFNQAQRAFGILPQGTALGRHRKQHSRLKACGIGL